MPCSILPCTSTAEPDSERFTCAWYFYRQKIVLMPIFDHERDELPGATSYWVESLLFSLYTELRGATEAFTNFNGKKKCYNELRFPADKLHQMVQK